MKKILLTVVTSIMIFWGLFPCFGQLYAEDLGSGMLKTQGIEETEKISEEKQETTVVSNIGGEGKQLSPMNVLKDNKLIQYEGIKIGNNELKIGNKTIQLKEFDGFAISNNKQYIAVYDYNSDFYNPKTLILYDNDGNILWAKEYKRIPRDGLFDRIIISDLGYTALFYGSEDTASSVVVLDTQGKVIRAFSRWGKDYNVIYDKKIKNIYSDNAHFAKNSNNLFFGLVNSDGNFILVGINEFGEIIFYEKFNSSISNIWSWQAKTYFHKEEKRILINSDCIGEHVPALTYWSVGRNEKIFERAIKPGEGIKDVAFSKDGDILVLMDNPKKEKIISRLDSRGQEKGKISIKKYLKSEEVTSFRVDEQGMIKINGAEVMHKNEIK